MENVSYLAKSSFNRIDSINININKLDSKGVKIGKFNELQGPSFAYPFLNFDQQSENKKSWALISKSVLGDVNGLPIKNMVLKRNH